MSRVRSRVAAHQRHKAVLAQTVGHRGKRRTNFKIAHESLIHALRYNTVDRKDRKANFRRLWIMRINAAARLHGLTYGRFINGLLKAGIDLDRKALADIAIRDANAFGVIAAQARAALA